MSSKIKLSKNAKTFFIKENIKLYRLLTSLNFKYLGNWEDELANRQSFKLTSDKKYELEDLLEFYNERIVEKIFLDLEKYTKMIEKMLDHQNINLNLITSFQKGMENNYDHAFLCLPIDEYFDFRFGHSLLIETLKYFDVFRFALKPKVF